MFKFDAVRHERRHPWASLALRLAVCLLLSWGIGRLLGVFGLLISLPLWGRAFAPELLEMGSWAYRSLRGLALRDVSGRYYVFKGHSLRVLEDELEPRRWLLLDDLARALDEPISASALRLRHPEGLRQFGSQLYLSDDAALAHLAERHSPRSARLRLWVEREVWFPARGRRAHRPRG